MELIAISINKIFKSNLLRNASKLATGTAISQVLALAFIPILSRTYSQDAFGIFAAYFAVVSIISSYATLKYDTALVLPKHDKDAYTLLKLSNIVTVAITVLSIGILLIPIPYFREYRGLQLFIGFSVLLSVNYNNSALWNIRFKQFNHTAISHVLQSIAIFVFQFLLYQFFELKGLIIGNIIGVSFSCAYLLITRKFDWSVYKSINKHDMLMQARRYVDFPKYFTLSNAVLSFSSNLPILLFVKYISLAQIGIYGMAVRIIAQPVTLISNSLRSVLLGEMAERRNKEKPILKWYTKIFVSLFLLTVVGSLLLFFLSNFIVEIFLGKEWSEVGLYAKMLIPLLISMMISSPGIAAVRVFEMQRYNFHYSLVSLSIKAGVLLVLFSWGIAPFEYIILIYSIVNLGLVLGNNSIIFNKIRRYEKEISK